MTEKTSKAGENYVAYCGRKARGSLPNAPDSRENKQLGESEDKGDVDDDDDDDDNDDDDER